MGKSSVKPSMMRFEPKSGWSDAGGQVISINDHLKSEDKLEYKIKIDSEPLSAEALINLGESMQDVFDSLKINDPRLQAWTQVHAAIRLIGGKIQEQKKSARSHRSTGFGNRRCSQPRLRTRVKRLPWRAGSTRDVQTAHADCRVAA